jgi:16S rRNA (adenine1518-N6/adenine1519-N6)-dimethyltransferase
MRIYSAKTIKEVLAQHDTKALKTLGQNFLVDANVLEKITAVAELKSDDVVLEIGPGLGVLTQALAVKAKKVIAVEKDRQFVPYLREKYKDAKNLEVVEGDIHQIPLTPPFLKGELLLLPLEKGGWEGFFYSNYKIVANLPYYITSRFLRLFLEELPNKPQSMTLMVQKEVAERICAKPPNMNLLALSVQAFGKPRILFRVAAGSFSPPPEVDSAVIAIENISDAFFKKHHISPKEFFELPKKAFSQKRKMLRTSIGKSPEGNLPEIMAIKRLQELSLENWTSLAK